MAGELQAGGRLRAIPSGAARHPAAFSASISPSLD
jgi:hypothetical protein